MAVAVASGSSWVKHSLFTPKCWEVLKHARDMANKRGGVVIENIDLLASLSDSNTKPGKVIHDKADSDHIIIEVDCRAPRAKPFDEIDENSNFDSETRRVLGLALLNVHDGGGESIDVKDLVQALVYNRLSPPRIKEILDKFNVDLPTLYRSLSA
jgi:ATP-dependent Clp protease ATP-binding subunit ClpA